MLAHVPSWASNPNYTTHATTSKEDEKKHKPVFEVFSVEDKQK
jgi:hypothetical protein